MHQDLPHPILASSPTSLLYHRRPGHRSAQGNGGLTAVETQMWLRALSKYFNINAFAMLPAEVVSSTYGGNAAGKPAFEAKAFGIGGECSGCSGTTTAYSGGVSDVIDSIDESGKQIHLTNGCVGVRGRRTVSPHISYRNDGCRDMNRDVKRTR